MEIKPNQHIVLLFHITSSNNQAQIKNRLIKDLKEYATIAQQDIILQSKDAKFSAYIRLPEQAATKLCAKKQIQLSGGEKAHARRYYADYQIFIKKINESITKEEVQKHFEKYGKISSVQITDAHSIEHQSKVVIVNRHCYIRFETDEDAEKCVMGGNQKINGHDLRVVRNYRIGQTEETDRKIFVKVIPNVLNLEAFEKTLNEKFSEIGKLRQRIRIQENQNTKFNATYMNQQAYQKAMQTLNNSKIGDHILVLRLFISPSKDAYRIFVSGLRPILESDLEKAFSIFGKIHEKAILSTRKPDSFNAVITFQTEQAMKKAIVEARQIPQIQRLFYGQPYVTIHMNHKQRRQYDNFNKKSDSGFSKPSNTWNSTSMPFNPIGMQMGMQPMNMQPIGMQPIINPMMRQNQPHINFNQPIMGVVPPGMGNKIGPNFQMKPNIQN